MREGVVVGVAGAASAQDTQARRYPAWMDSPPAAQPRKVALVTGAARRIGAAIARAAACRRLLTSRCITATAGGTCRRCRPTSRRCAWQHAGPAGRPRRVRPPAGTGRARWAIWPARPAGEQRLVFSIPRRSARPRPRSGTTFASNARAPFFLAQAAAPHLKATRGAIVNWSTSTATSRSPGIRFYGMATALRMLTKGLALDLAPEVRVNAIAPAPSCGPTAARARRHRRPARAGAVGTHQGTPATSPPRSPGWRARTPATSPGKCWGGWGRAIGG